MSRTSLTFSALNDSLTQDESSAEKEFREETLRKQANFFQNFQQRPVESSNLSLQIYDEFVDTSDVKKSAAKRKIASWPIISDSPTKNTPPHQSKLFAQILVELLKQNRIEVLAIDSRLIASTNFQGDLDAILATHNHSYIVFDEEEIALERKHLIDQFNFEHDCFFDELILSCAKNNIKLAITHATTCASEKLVTCQAVLNKIYLLLQGLHSPIVGAGIFKYDLAGATPELPALENIAQTIKDRKPGIGPKIFLWSDNLYDKITAARPRNFQLFNDTGFLAALKHGGAGYLNDVLAFPQLAKYLLSSTQGKSAATTANTTTAALPDWSEPEYTFSSLSSGAAAAPLSLALRGAAPINYAAPSASLPNQRPAASPRTYQQSKSAPLSTPPQQGRGSDE